MSAPIDPKVWSDLQARAALNGCVLMRSDGAATVVVLVDRQGRAHRLHDADDLTAAVQAHER